MGTFIQTFWKTTLVAVIITASIVVLPVNATTLTQANDYPSSLVAGAVANHQLLFTTQSGVSEGDTIQVTFSTDFITVGLTENDVDIADDGLDLTTASDCSGVEQVSVVIAGSVITLTICPGDGGAIAVASEISIEIGTNATASGIGSVRITNPINVGTHFVSIRGTFGDVGSIALPLVSAGTATITATIPAPAVAQARGGAQVRADVTAPIISNIVVSEITTTSATVSWNTNEPANGFVDYGTTEAFEIGTQLHEVFRAVHSVQLFNLVEGTKYYFRIRSADINANSRTSSTQSFSTLDITPPLISDVGVSSITTTSARITWQTNEIADSTVNYGKTVAYGSMSSKGTLELIHDITVVGLKSSTKYHFHVSSSDASDNSSSSADLTFTTAKDNPPANVSNLTVASANMSLTLSWVNPIDEDLSGILVRSCPNAFPNSVNDPDCQTVFQGLAESYIHKNLQNDTTYYYGVFAYDRVGQFASGALGSGAPKAPEEEKPVKEVLVPKDEDNGADKVPEKEIPVVPKEVQPGLKEDKQPVSPLGAGDIGKLDFKDISFVVANSIKLSLSAFNTIDVLSLKPLQIWVPASEFKADLVSVIVKIGDQAYLMRLSKDASVYQTDILTPFTEQSHLFELTAEYEASSKESVSSIVRVVSDGNILQNIDGEEAPVSDVFVRLYQKIGDELVAWDGSSYEQLNPQLSGDGSYAYYVPNDLYVLHTTAQGYRDYDSEVIAVTNNIVNASFFLTAYTPEMEDEPVQTTEITAPNETPTGILQSSLALIWNVLDSSTLQAAYKALEYVRDVEAVQTTAKVATPTLAVIAGASVVLMTVAFDFIPLLQYFFTSPVLLFWRKKRKKFGVVYNANTKTPVDLAVVRLYNYDPQKPNGLGRLVKSRVTDKAGRFFFLLQQGQYKIVVSKRAFVYPALSLASKKEDGDFLDLYHGEPLTVTEENAILTPNIPMDPKDPTKELTPKRVIWKRRIRVAQTVVAISGIGVTSVIALVRPGLLTYSMIGIQVLVYALAQRLAKPANPKDWGIVYDNETKRPIGNVVARIFEPKYNKLLDMQVSDSKGRYAFLLGTGDYYAVFEKPEYRNTQVQPIRVDANKDAKAFSVNVELYKE